MRLTEPRCSKARAVVTAKQRSLGLLLLFSLVAEQSAESGMMASQVELVGRVFVLLSTYFVRASAICEYHSINIACKLYKAWLKKRTPGMLHRLQK